MRWETKRLADTTCEYTRGRGVWAVSTECESGVEDDSTSVIGLPVPEPSGTCLGGHPIRGFSEGPFENLVFLGKAGFTLPVFAQLLGVAGDVTKEFGRVVVERVDGVAGEFRQGRRYHRKDMASDHRSVCILCMLCKRYGNDLGTCAR